MRGRTAPDPVFVTPSSPEPIDGRVPTGLQRVLVVYERDGLDVVALPPTRPLVVGRTEPADLRPRSRRLSRRHAQFMMADGQVWVEDLGSSNGTFVDGQQIDALTAVPLGAEVQLGSVVIVPHRADERWLFAVGLPDHPRFDVLYATEVERARTFGRTFALVVIRLQAPAGSALPSLPAWIPRLAARLRSVDRLAVFGPDTVQILLPEMSGAEAAQFARTVATGFGGDLSLLAGVAVYPDDGQTLAELTEAARTSILRACPPDPITVDADSDDDDDEPIIHDPAVRALYRTVDRVADSQISVLIVGDTGTGKEVLARAIHQRSERAAAPMRVVNCGAIPSTLVESTLFGHEKGAFTGADRRRIGVFEEASGGTVLLDEIGELPLLAQVALLRVLETRRIQRIGSSQEVEVDVRVLAATHRDLEAMCAERAFRWDLLYRLNGIILRIPPLRDRPSEIQPLLRRFVRESNRINGRAVRAITPEALQQLERYPWPGNVRELRNTVDRAVVVANGPVLTVEDLPERLTASLDLSRMLTEVGGEPFLPPLTSPPSSAHPGPRPFVEGTPIDLKASVRAYEIDLIRAALRQADGNQTQAAETLAIPRRTLVYKIRAYQIGEWERSAPFEPAHDAAGRPLQFSIRVERFERHLIESALNRTNGDQRLAARLLNIRVRTLEHKRGRGM